MAKKILVVDDEPGIVETICERLKAVNYEVIPAFSGEEALEKVKEELPDLIVLDIMMKGTDGFTVLDRLRHEPMTRYTPVIMLTAKGDTASIIRARDLGSTDYIIKPFSVEDLTNLIKKYV